MNCWIRLGGPQSMGMLSSAHDMMVLMPSGSSQDFFLGFQGG